MASPMPAYVGHTELSNSATWELSLCLLTVSDFGIKEQTNNEQQGPCLREAYIPEWRKDASGWDSWRRLHLSWELQNDREVFQVTKGRGVSHAEEATHSGSEMRMCQASWVFTHALETFRLWARRQETQVWSPALTETKSLHSFIYSVSQVERCSRHFNFLMPLVY